MRTDFAAERGRHETVSQADKTSVRHRRRKVPPPGYVTVPVLAARSGAALSTAYSWIQQRRIPASRWRHIVVVAEGDVEKFLAITPLQPAAPNAMEDHHD